MTDDLPRGKDGRILWPKVPRFTEWFQAVAPELTDDELAHAMADRYGVPASSVLLQNLRSRYRGRISNRALKRATLERDEKRVERTDAEVLHEMKLANRRLMQQLAEAKAKRDELVAAVYRAAKDAAESLELKPVPKPKLAKSARKPEAAIAVLGDWQLAKRTATYNSTVCEERIERYAEKVLELTTIQRADHPVPELRVYLLGDLVEGELIFPGQAHLVDASLYRQVMVDGPRILGNFVRRMLGHFERVRVVGVIGNHGALGGRAHKDYHPESNADAMMYEATRMRFENETRIEWDECCKPMERGWYAVDYVGKKGFLLFHGDQVKGGFAGLPWYGFAKKLMGWRMGAIPEPFDYALAGHFHTPTRMLVGQVTVWVSGSTESDNTYAAEMLAAQGKPSQWLLFAEPERGVSAEYQVFLD
jgi:hypothetical protein